jgi:hypothetical protein
MTWYRGVKTDNDIIPGEELYETDDEVLEEYRREGEKSDEQRYIVELDGERKTVFRVWFSAGKWNREVVWKHSTPPSER